MRACSALIHRTSVRLLLALCLLTPASALLAAEYLSHTLDATTLTVRTDEGQVQLRFHQPGAADASGCVPATAAWRRPAPRRTR